MLSILTLSFFRLHLFLYRTMWSTLRQAISLAPSASWRNSPYCMQLIRLNNSDNNAINQIAISRRHISAIAASSHHGANRTPSSTTVQHRLGHHAVTKPSSVPYVKPRMGHYPWGEVPSRCAHTEKEEASFDVSDDCVVARHGDKTFHCSYFWLRDHCR